ncbi:MAG: type II toxin-antitoxin system CcdA family antitoxin [Nitrospirae bacterium]|nr:type II toxin-antitoxin system CcdA family antitoxin [Nitrospirota bacterium]
MRYDNTVEARLNTANESHSEENTQESKHRKWLEENSDAIDAYNRRIGTQGEFSKGLRRY